MSSWASATRFRWPPESVAHLGGGVGDLEPCQHRTGIRLDLPAAVHFEFVLEIGHSLHRRGIRFSGRHIVTNVLIIADRLHHAAARRKDRLKHRQVFVVRRILRKIRERLAFCPHNAARIRLLDTRNDPQKRRLARAVRTDNSDLVTVFETESHILKQRLKTVVLRDIFERDDVHKLLSGGISKAITARLFAAVSNDQICFDERIEQVHGTLLRDFEGGPDLGGGHAPVVGQKSQKLFLPRSQHEF